MKLALKTFNTLAILLLLTTLIGVLSRVNAQTGGISMTPVETEIRATQGDPASGSFVITNNHDKTLGFLVNYGEVQDDKVTEVADSASFLAADVRSFVLQPGQSQTINFSFTVPSTQVDGFYVPVVIVRGSEESEGAAVVAAIGHRINLFVSGNGQYKSAIQLNSFDYTDSNSFDSNISVDVNYTNAGTYPSKILGRFQIVDQNGNVLYQRVINEGLKYLSAGNSLDETFSFDFNILDTITSAQKTAELQLTDTYTGQTQVFRLDITTQNKTLYVLIGGGVGIILLTLVGGSASRRRKKNLSNK